MAMTVPTKSNLIAAQKSLRLAKLGYYLLDRKKNILVRELLRHSDDAKSIRKQVSESYKKAYDALRAANLTVGSFDGIACCVPVDDSIEFEQKMVMGMSLPSMSVGEGTDFAYFGLIGTNGYLDRAYRCFNEAKRLTVSLAATEADVCRLADAIKKTQKRANALGNVQIPMLTEKIKLISEALDEKEREDFSRLKMIKKDDV